MSIIDSLQWRYATKKFDPNKKVSDTDIATLKEAVRLTPSSYGFQLYKVLIITDQKIKDKLYKKSYYQSQIRDCSHLFVFCSYKTANSKHIDEFIHLMEQGRQQDDERGYMDKLKSKAKILSPSAPRGTMPGSTTPLDRRLQSREPTAIPTIKAPSKIEIKRGWPLRTVTV